MFSNITNFHSAVDEGNEENRKHKAEDPRMVADEPHEYDGIDSDMEELTGELTDDECDPLPLSSYAPPPHVDSSAEDGYERSKKDDQPKVSSPKKRKYTRKSETKFGTKNNTSVQKQKVNTTEIVEDPKKTTTKSGRVSKRSDQWLRTYTDALNAKKIS